MEVQQAKGRGQSLRWSLGAMLVQPALQLPVLALAPILPVLLPGISFSWAGPLYRTFPGLRYHSATCHLFLLGWASLPHPGL